jgi:YVTN family beta-propeller protein
MRFGAFALALLLVGGALVITAPADLNNPTGTRGLLLVDHGGAKARFLDPKTFRELAAIDVPMNPHEVAISPDHRWAYTPIYGDGVYGWPLEKFNAHPGHEIAVIDLTNKRFDGNIDVSPCRAPHGIQIDASGRLYASCETARSLLIVDPKLRRVIGTIDNQAVGHFFVVTPEGKKAYVANRDQPTVSVIDLKARKLLKQIDTSADGPNGTDTIAVSPDGNRVAVIPGGPDSLPEVMFIDTATDRVVARIGLTAKTGPTRVRYSLNGHQLLVSINRPEQMVNIIDVDNPVKPPTLLKVGGGSGFALTADGTKAVVPNFNSGALSIIDLVRLRVIDEYQTQPGIDSLTFY